ncbi:hypothetical protein M378DRAFT_194984 [Amanita muscaria Koide BX008]|uniref:Zn(2)-C6 fungal-type domain-containing protein n=1 Tax=Amanita muscaria (strain Koide BX008) TaxID=946122 RepID=A0A0C2TTU0_AMAMK|nr:hypothetical protein M378DRAFT_194984 [Amanita muscaria Koide BX008]
MPKVATETSRKPTNPVGRNPHPNILKRNQACHQCRRRKLKCDAQKPSCSTCIRSHNHTIVHAPPGTPLPPKPTCTYDEVTETNIPAEGPKNKYERLESRINELEALLRQKQESEAATSAQNLTSTTDSTQSPLPGPSTETIAPLLVNVPLESAYIRSPEDLDALHVGIDGSYTFATDASGPVFPPTPRTSYDLVWSSWPPALPQQPLLLHLVDVFFKFHLHAHRLFHRPTFLTSLSFPPNHPKFPCSAVLHAICAAGSLYTAAVTSPPQPTFEEFPPDELFLERRRLKEQRPDSFAEQQAKYAKETIDRLNALGKDLFPVLQASIVLTWFYWPHGRWVDVFFSSAFSMRLSVPLGLNTCPPFHSITRSQRPVSILLPARTVIEDEIRRNAFWLAYATERLHGYGNPWALNLDDQDISQLLPVRGEEFDRGHLVLPQDRQWAHTKNVLLENPEQVTDSFTLYIKSSILMSRVKTFNLRFRARHSTGDATVASVSQETSERVDPRHSPAFIELDYIIDSFTATFPSRCRNPIMNNILDSHLYTAWQMPHVCSIILHDPHANIQHLGCISAMKILRAARSILDLVYSVCSTSFDITLLEPFCLASWFCAGHVLARFLQAAQDSNIPDQCATLQAELGFLHTALMKQGERIPLASRFAKMLDNLIATRQASESNARTPFPDIDGIIGLDTLDTIDTQPSLARS